MPKLDLVEKVLSQQSHGIDIPSKWLDSMWFLKCFERPSLPHTLQMDVVACFGVPFARFPLHYGIRADIFKKSYQKIFNFKNWFLCQFSSNIWFFLAGAVSIPQKLENAKMNLQISIQGGVKLKKREGGGCHGRNGSQNFRFYKCYDICFHNFCDKRPLMGKKRFQSLKKIFFKYLTSFFGCCRRPNIWFVTLLSLSLSSSSTLSSAGPFFHLSGIFECGKNDDYG